MDDISIVQSMLSVFAAQAVLHAWQPTVEQHVLA
jgi:hypothetical protein